MPEFITPQQIIDDLKKVASNLGRTPLTNEYTRFGIFTPPTVLKRFGSWADALKAAGLEPTELHRRYWTDIELDSEIERLENELGHKPSWREIRAHSKISEYTFMRRKGRTGFNDPWNVELPEWDVDKIPIEDGFWISGFVVGEGCFIAQISRTTFSITQRSDTIDLLEFSHKTLGLPGNIHTATNDRRRAMGQKVGDEARLSVSNRWILKLRIIPFFDRFPLRGRKQAEYQVFKQAVEFLCERDKRDGRKQKYFTDEERKFLTELADTIKALRYDPTAHKGGPQ